MSTAAIAVHDLGKEYRLGANQGIAYETLRDTIAAAAASVLGSDAEAAPAASRQFWALRHVSLEIPRGQVVGVIGRNGAGKSTFLKILSRITKPTEGYADLVGRVGSLLEVGTGFHPELTGRENIFLNGAILGMRRAEIVRSFDAIVDFAGVSAFLETPVKRYSSGMYVRLAFAVAAHLETEILLVDEVLAVGDAEFQRKCLGKIQNVVREGRTVLFVSHNMAAVRALCERAVWLDGGRVARDGTVDEVVDAYLGNAAPAAQHGRIDPAVPRTGSGEARFRGIALTTNDDSVRQDLYLGEPFQLTLELDVLAPVPDAVIEVGISTLEGTRVATMFSVDAGREAQALEVGTWQVALTVSATLLPRAYAVDLGLHRARYGVTVDWIERVVMFNVLAGSRSGLDTHFSSQTRGYFRPEAAWQIAARAPSRAAGASTA